MPTDVPIRCACGALRGVAKGLSGRAGNRVVCYCDDCQSFAHAIGSAAATLDSHGGTDIFQTSPARLEITEGAENLGCLRLRKGGLLRWHTTCCNTAIGNTSAASGMPFVGLIVSCMDLPGGTAGRAEAVGPVRMRAAASFAKGDLVDVKAHDGMPLAMAFRLAPMVLLARIRGDQKRSPFFHFETGKPASKPRVLSDAELREVEAARDA